MDSHRSFLPYFCQKLISQLHHPHVRQAYNLTHTSSHTTPRPVSDPPHPTPRLELPPPNRQCHLCPPVRKAHSSPPRGPSGPGMSQSGSPPELAPQTQLASSNCYGEMFDACWARPSLGLCASYQMTAEELGFFWMCRREEFERGRGVV